MQDRLYWLGNAAKVKIIAEILEQVRKRKGEVLIFDYGCGSGGDWRNILVDFPNLTVIGYDPYRARVEAGRSKLEGMKATLYTGDELNGLDFKADFVVSFSVFEHVYDRRKYLQTAKDHLADDGKFYLNYDDGHFRNNLDLNAPRSWRNQLLVWLHNLLAPTLAQLGNLGQFQQRVQRATADRLVAEVGFNVLKVFYSNVASLKGLHKVVAPEKQPDFARLWLALEDDLNARFLEEGSQAKLGDNTNLWQFMASRTLVLQHKQA